MPASGAFEASTPAERADEAVPRLGDHERRPARTIRRLAQDHLELARVVLRRELARRSHGSTSASAHDAALRLRDDLLRDHDDVAVLELDPLGDQRREVVALARSREARRPG